jgi:hypothetical protein
VLQDSIPSDYKRLDFCFVTLAAYFQFYIGIIDFQIQIRMSNQMSNTTRLSLSSFIFDSCSTAPQIIIKKTLAHIEVTFANVVPEMSVQVNCRLFTITTTNLQNKSKLDISTMTRPTNCSVIPTH